jgi:formylglycine-generating enzyme required for sulfatase activity
MCVALAGCSEAGQQAPDPSPAIPETSATPTDPAAAVPASSKAITTPSGCPDGMVSVPSGVYLVGDPDPPLESWYRLKEAKVTLPGFCIDQYEYPGRIGEFPTGAASWHEAAALCKKADKRLCSEHEWVAACRGPEGWSYAYGAEFEAARCQTDGHKSKVEPIGSRTGCTSPLGVHDLNGSLSEWVADTWDRAPLPPLDGDETLDPASPHHVLRGGTMWFSIYGQDCRSRHSHHPGQGHTDDGFRCCADL